MIHVKEDGAAGDLLMGKKFLGNGAFSGVAQAGKPLADTSGLMASDYKLSRWNCLRRDFVTFLPEREAVKNGIQITDRGLRSGFP